MSARKRVTGIRTGLWVGLVLAFGAAGLILVACGEREQKADQAASEATQLYTCSMHPQVVQDHPGNCPICGMTLTPLKTEMASQSHAEHEHAELAEVSDAAPSTSSTDGKKGKKILYWRAPMDPTYISDKPGKSPMGMDLIPVYEGEEDLTSGPTVSIDPVVIQNIGVRTAPAVKKELYRIIRTVGHLDYNEEKLYRVNIKFSGWIERLFVDETGQEVRRGQPMLEIYSPELVATQEEYLLAYNSAKRLSKSPFASIAEGGQTLLEATRRRLLYWDITEEQIKVLEETGMATKTMTLYSPFDGIVVSKHAEEGMYVKPGMDLYRMADLSSIWVYAHIYEYEVPWIREGQMAEMELPYIPGEIFQGRVDYIYPYLDQKTRDVKIRIVFQNPGLKLKPEMYANVRLKSELGRAVVAIPSEAVIHSGKRNVVFVAKGGGKFEPRDVVLGPEAEGGYYEVIQGVREGEEVVTSAQFLLDSESRLKEAIQKMLEVKTKKGQAGAPPDSMPQSMHMDEPDHGSEQR